MQNYKFILIIVLVVTFPNIPQAKMYKWVDQNGKVTYSNVAPPSSAQKVETFKETTEAPMDRAIRIENEQIQEEKAAALKKYKKEQRRLLREEQKRIVKTTPRTTHHRPGLTKAQQKMLDDMARRTFTAPGFKGKARKARIHSQQVQNQRRIDELRAQFLGANPAIKSSNTNTVFSAQNQQNRTYADGENDAWLGKPKKSHGGSYAAGYDDEEDRNTNRNSTINGEWDMQGRHYTPAGGGNAWRDDGTFMQKAAGGYIDTKTGQHVPAN